MKKLHLFSLILILKIFIFEIKTVNCDVVPLVKAQELEKSVINDYDDDYNYKEDRKLIRKHVEIMHKAMNTSVSPCDNFSEYACGNYVKDMYGIGVYPNLASEEYVEIAFQDGSKLFEAASKARDFYVSCKTKKTVKENLEKVIALKEEGITWPILEKDWTRDKSSAWINISENLKLLELPTILEFNKTGDILEVSYGRDFSERVLDKREIDEMEKVLLQEFHMDPNSAKTIVNEISEFSRKRSSLFGTVGSLCVHCPSTETYDLRLDLRTLKEDFTGINWDRFLEMNFGRKLHDWEPVYIKHYLKTVPYLEFLSKTNHRILTNYIVWKMLYRLQKLDDEGQNESCATKTFTKFDSIVPALYSQILFNDFHRQQYLEILKQFKQSYDESKCRYNSVNTNDLELIFTTEIDYIRNLDAIFSSDKLNKDFKLVEIHPNNYYQNLINLGLHTNCQLYDKNCIKRVHLMVFIFEVTSMFQKPFYYSFTDKYFSLWETIVRNAFNRGWNSIKYESAKTCTKLQLKYTKIPIADSDPVQSIITSTTLKQVYSDYKRWLLDNEDDERDRIFNEFNLNSRKVFFINFLQAYCNQEEKHRSTIHQSLLNMEEFSREFKCFPNAPMNPLQRCRVV